MSNILWVDDVRDPPITLQCDVVRTYSAAIKLLSTEQYNTIYLDHDLADFDGDKEYTGYSILLWLVERKMSGHTVPTEYHLLTANPVGRLNMISIIDRYLR